MPEYVDVERDASRSDLADVMHALADGIDSGALAIEGGDARVEFQVPLDVAYELEVESDSEDESEEDGDDSNDNDDGDSQAHTVELEIEVSWPAGPEHAVATPTVGPRKSARRFDGKT